MRQCARQNVNYACQRAMIAFAVAAFAFVCGAASPLAAQEDWPVRPVTMVVAFAPGGGTDVLGRIVGRRLAEVLGQQVIIENVGGAGGMIGSAGWRKRRPTATSSCSAAGPMPSIRRSTGIRSTIVTDLAPVALIAEQPNVLVTRKDLPAEILSNSSPMRGRTRPACNMARPAPARPAMSTARCLNAAIGVNITHVPYRGAGPAHAGSDRRPHRLFCTQSATVVPQIAERAGQARLQSSRAIARPCCRTSPAAHEQGLEDFEAHLVRHCSCPRDTPARSSASSHDAALATMETPSVRERLKDVGATVVAPERRSTAYLQELRRERDREKCRPHQGRRHFAGLRTRRAIS